MNDVADVPLSDLEHEITSLAGHLASGTCRFLLLLARFDAGGGWQGAGLRSCAQWLSWRCGLSSGAAHEQLRVARALLGLPVVREAFGAGRLSYSKVRALTRVATAADEADLVGVATACTAAQLDRLCAGLGRVRSDREVVEQRAARSDAAALVEIARHAISAPAPAVGASPVRLVVHTTEQALVEIGESGDRESSAGVWTDHPESTPVTVGVLDAGPAIPPVPLGPATMRRLLCEAVVEAATGRTTNRFANARQRRALLARDYGCAFPGCPRRRALHAHHVEHWAHGGRTEIENLALLCERHHLALHEEGWQLVKTPAGWAAAAPDGRFHQPAPAITGDAAHLVERSGATDPTAISGTWAGDRLDLDYAVAVLARRGKHERAA